MNKCFSFPAGVVQISRWGNIRSAHVDTERILYERILLLAIADFDMLGSFSRMLKIPVVAGADIRQKMEIRLLR